MTWTTRAFSRRVWEETEPTRRAIDALPLLTELADGSLEPHRFAEYLAQDDFYLRGYARALAMLATRAPTAEASAFWAASASGAVAAEVDMHATLMADPRLADQPRAAAASPTTRAYVNLLQTAAAYEPYPVGVAAVLVAVTLGLGGCANPFSGAVTPAAQVGTQDCRPEANRDPEAFPEPDRFDIRRKAIHHIAFSFGSHQCMGQALARAELQIVFGKLFQRFPNLKLAVPFEELTFRYDAFVYGIDSLPVSW